MEQLGKGYDPRTKTLSSQTSSSISLYLPMLFFCRTTPFFLPITYLSYLLQAFISLQKVEVK